MLATVFCSTRVVRSCCCVSIAFGEYITISSQSAAIFILTTKVAEKFLTYLLENVWSSFC